MDKKNGYIWEGKVTNKREDLSLRYYTVVVVFSPVLLQSSLRKYGEVRDAGW